MENESPNYKANEVNGDVIMANANSQLDQEVVEDSYYSQTDNGKVLLSDVDPESLGQNGTESRKGDLKKRRQVKKSKSGLSKLKKTLIRPTEDNCSNDFQRYRESVEEFTNERSRRIAKERIDIVESRSLCMNVSQF